MHPHFKFAFRALRKHLTPSFINFTGFTIGITGALLLVAILKHDLSYDRYHQRGSELMRMSIRLDLPSGQRHFASTSVISAENLAETLPEVEARIRMRSMPATINIEERVFANEPISYVDSAYFQYFRSDLLMGQYPQSREQILISSRAAERLFGDDDPVGAVLQVEAAYGNEGLMITGVFESYPTNTTFRPSFLASFDLIEGLHNPNHGAIMPFLNTYLAVSPGTEASALNEKLNAFYEENLPDNLFNVLKPEVEPYWDMHFTSGLEFDLGQKHDAQTIWILGILAAFILASTIINYFNMQTALSVQRVKESSIKKALGQNATDRWKQSIYEGFILLFPAFALSGLLAFLAIGWVESYTDLSLSTGVFSVAQMPWILAAAFLVFWLFAVLISFILQRNTTNKMMLGRSKPSFGLLKRGLIGLQFALAGFFIFSALVISGQLSFIESRSLGYEQEGMMTIELTGVSGFQDAENIKTSLKTVPGVKTASISQSRIFGNQGKSNFVVHQDTGTVSMLLNYNLVDEDFLSTTRLVLLAGEDIPADRNQLLINQEAVKTLGFGSIEASLGRKMTFTRRDTSIDYTIGGVVADFHYATLRSQVEPIVLLKSVSGGYYNLTVKTENTNYEALADRMQLKWNERFPGQELNYRVMSEVLAQAYQDDSQKATFYQYATLLLIMISALGIFGLTYYYADQKRKEIGIRKAIGARLGSILLQVGRPIAWLCGIAALVAVPLGYYLSQQWLSGYQYQISIGAGQVLITLLLMILLSAIALLYPGLRASNINPVDALREE